MTVREWLRGASERLARADIESPALDAQVLLAESLGVDRAWLMAHPDEHVGSGLADRWLDRRERREPLAYIVGWREFYGRRFAVGPGVLVPRQETETLIEAGLENDRGGLRMLDLGTGSGCIAITLKLERPSWDVAGVDISDAALGIAARNAKALRADVAWVKSDGFASLNESQFDLIVSNPPYIAEGEDLMPEVGAFEPQGALFAGSDGLDFYRRIASEAPTHLRSDGLMLLEVGHIQADLVRAIFEGSGWSFKNSRFDLSGIERVLCFSQRHS